MENKTTKTTETITATLKSLSIARTSEGKEFVAAILNEGSLNTKSTTRSYMVALTGASLAVQLAKDELEKMNLSIINDSIITWERTIYPAGSVYQRLGDSQTHIAEVDEVVDHITKVDLTPIGLNLLNKYLEDHDEPQQGSLKERVLLKGFGVEL